MPLDPTNWDADGKVLEADYVHKDGRSFFFVEDAVLVLTPERMLEVLECSNSKN